MSFQSPFSIELQWAKCARKTADNFFWISFQLFLVKFLLVVNNFVLFELLKIFELSSTLLANKILKMRPYVHPQCIFRFVLAFAYIAVQIDVSFNVSDHGTSRWFGFTAQITKTFSLQSVLLLSDACTFLTFDALKPFLFLVGQTKIPMCSDNFTAFHAIYDFCVNSFVLENFQVCNCEWFVKVNF